jgi:hypothetical protein
MARLRFVGSAHFDQPGRVTGRLDLHGTKFEVDCYAIRDRSWGPRADKGGLRAGYSSGTASPANAFHAISAVQDGPGTIVAGYLLRDGELTSIQSGTRQVLERVERMPKQIAIDAVDASGRELHARGECVNRLAFLARPANLTCMSLTRWTFDNQQAWGEDQDIWSPDTWLADYPPGGH